MTLRSSIRQTLIDKGLDPKDADEVVDLSFHLAEKVAQVFPQVASTASSPSNELNVILISSSLVLAQVKQARDVVTDMLGELLESAEVNA